MIIAICDDSRRDMKIADDVVRNTLKQLHVQHDILHYLSAHKVRDRLFIHKEDIDILILDIDMPDTTGLEIASEIRNNGLDTLIIFLTNHEEFVFSAFEFQPFRYIRKIKISEEMPIALNSAVKAIEMKRDKQILLNTEDGEEFVSLSQIMYIEADKRKTVVHLTNNKELLSAVNITEISEIINSEKFILIHRSCIVNTDYLSNIKNDVIVLKNNEQLVISRRRSKDIKNRIMRLWGDKI